MTLLDITAELREELDESFKDKLRSAGKKLKRAAITTAAAGAISLPAIAYGTPNPEHPSVPAIGAPSRSGIRVMDPGDKDPKQADKIAAANKQLLKRKK